jgi:AcrR family transcriptional regulator
MDRIAESAAVSVKTIYRHFENKDELFSAVMQAACRADNSIPAERGDDASPAAIFTWFEESPGRRLLPLAETIFAICSRQSNSRFIASSPGMLIVFLNLAAATRKKS